MRKKNSQVALLSVREVPARMIAMSRIEVILPAWHPTVPLSLLAILPADRWCDAGGSNCFAIFGCELARELSDAEVHLLDQAMLAREIILYDVLTR